MNIKDDGKIPSDESGRYLAVLYFCNQEVSNQTQEKNAAQRNKFSEEKPLYKPANGSSRGR